MKNKWILLASIATVSLFTYTNSQADGESAGSEYASRINELGDPGRTAQAISDVRGKLAACQNQNARDCGYYQDILDNLDSLPSEEN